MELKYLVVLSILGVAAGLAIPEEQQRPVIGESSDLESSFSGSSSDPSSAVSRDKRGLLLKKLKKHGSTMYVNRQYESSGSAAYRPGREVHHHHHYETYPNPPPPVIQQTYQPYPVPSQEYHHYHQQQGGYYASQGGSYHNGGGYYARPNYGDGGYAHYGGDGGWVAPHQQTQVSTLPIASGHTAVDRGQGAAAVNNIAIIHARSGSSANNQNLLESESRVLPRPLPVDIEDALDMMH